MAKKNVSKNKKEVKKEPLKDIKVDEQNTKENDKKEFVRLIKIILVVTVIFVVFYGVTLLVTKKSDEVLTKRADSNKTVEKAEIQYDNIMIGTMLNYDGSYYVLIEGEDDSRLDEYNSLIDSIKENEDSLNIYKANLTDSFNKGYLGKEENYYVSDISEFKVKGTVLVKIVDGNIDAVFDNYDAIKNKLTELS